MPGPDGVEFDDDPDRIDLDAVWDFLGHEAHWGRWRTRADLAAQTGLDDRTALVADTTTSDPAALGLLRRAGFPLADDGGTVRAVLRLEGSPAEDG